MRAAVPLQMRAAALRRRPHLTSRTVSRTAARADTRNSCVVKRRSPCAMANNAREHVPFPLTESRVSTRRPGTCSPQKRGVSVVPQAAAQIVAATGPSVPEIACAVSLGYMAAAFFAFLLGVRFPNRFPKCVLFTKSPMSLAPPCVTYLLLLVASWSPDTLSLMMPGSLEAGLSKGGFNPQFFPSLNGIAELLSRRNVAASAWMHLACVNLFVGRHASLKARAGGWGVAHTLILTFVFGPAGLFSHWVTQAYYGSSKKSISHSESQSLYGSGYGYNYGYAYGGGPADVPGKRTRATKHKFALMSSLF